MKIAIMAPLVTAIREPQQGGSQAFVSDLARGLVGRGHEVHVYAASGSQIPGVEVIDTGVDPRVSGGHALPGFRARRARRARYQRRPSPRSPAPIRACGRSSMTWSTITPSTRPRSGSRRRCTRRWSTRSTCLRTRRWRRRLVHAAQSGRPPAVAAVSVFQASAWRRIVRIDAILPPYVPTQAIPWSRAPGDGAVFAGRLSPEKGAAEAIDIARAAGVPIDVYGDAYDAEYSREQIGPRRAWPGVTVHEAVPRPSLWAAMARAAVVLYPVKWDEPFGMAAAEAQACGTPVVGVQARRARRGDRGRRDRLPGAAR